MMHGHGLSTRREVRRVLLITLVLNLAVAFGKIFIGLLSGALAITADGFHSLVDGLSNVVSLAANHLANKPPDDDHPYGHRRFETLGALVIGAFLLLTAWEVGRNAVARLQERHEPEITILTVVVLLVTLAVNLFVSTYERRAGQRLRSELLVADSEHTRADVYVTISVLGSLALVELGLLWVDAVAALVIVGLIARAAWGVLAQTSRVLVDTAPYPAEQLVAWVEEVPAVQQVRRARSRGPADAVQIDIDLQVARETTADHIEAIRAAIRQKLTQAIDGVAEIEVHFSPQTGAAPNYALAARACADALGLATHEVRVNEGPRGKLLEMHVEVAAGQTLAHAHERVSQLERDVKSSLPDIAEVLTHIEPAAKGTGGPQPPVAANRLERLQAQALLLLESRYPDAGWHAVRAHGQNDGLTLTAHAALPATITVEAAHSLAEEAETLLRSALPDIMRVTIHTEPPED